MIVLLSPASTGCSECPIQLVEDYLSERIPIMTGHDRSVRILLASVAFLLGANLLVSLRPSRTVLAAGIPDSGAQMQQQIDLLTQLNGKIDKLQGFLESGKLVVEAKENKAATK
jgi:hypothetical protein